MWFKVVEVVHSVLYYILPFIGSLVKWLGRSRVGEFFCLLDFTDRVIIWRFIPNTLFLLNIPNGLGLSVVYIMLQFALWHPIFNPHIWFCWCRYIFFYLLIHSLHVSFHAYFCMFLKWLDGHGFEQVNSFWVFHLLFFYCCYCNPSFIIVFPYFLIVEHVVKLLLLLLSFS